MNNDYGFEPFIAGSILMKCARWVSGQFVAAKFVATKFVATNSSRTQLVAAPIRRGFKFVASQIRRGSIY